jgi:protein O-GlcNAc transferase
MSENHPDSDIKTSIRQAFDLAVKHHHAGRLADAESIYQQILIRQPDNANALHLLGVLMGQTGRSQIAEELIRRAIGVYPSEAAFYNNLGNALLAQGKINEAASAYQTAIKLKPDFFGVYHNLASCLKAQGQLAAAVITYQTALQFKPDHVETLCCLGKLFMDQDRIDEAVNAYNSALRLNPRSPEINNALGIALANQGQYDQAITVFNRAIQIKPDYAEIYSNLGNVFKDQGRIDEAIAAYQTALRLKPELDQTYSNLGNLLKNKGRLGEAIKAFHSAIELNPNLAEAHSNLGNLLKDQGRIDEAITSCRRALKHKPELNQTHSNLIYFMHLDPACEVRLIYEETINWNQQHSKKFSQLIQPHPNDPAPDRRLRIGYVSPDFRTHSVAFFMENLITAHDRAQVETFCYADLPRPDDTSVRFQSVAYNWRKITGQSDQQVAEKICRDQIDILVDLTGHTSQNRLFVFARKPAPIQITYLGYPNTTGLTTIDYRFTDAYADPPGMNDAFYTEKLVRLQNTFLCYRPPDTAPVVFPPPSLKNLEHITFGCFNILPKINARVMEVWLQILRELPSSRMLIKNLGLSDADTRQDLYDKFAAAGIDRNRLDLREKISSLAGHMELYHQVDVALDTFPYNGTTTTCEALWMGVPVITLAGQMHMSRVGVSLLSNVGLPELIAQTPQQYVEIAVKLAGDLPRLTELRATLRQRMQASPLMDAPRFARNVEAAYRDMWCKWCVATTLE